MSGICGWIEPITSVTQSDADLQAMHRKLPPLGKVTEEAKGEHFSISLAAQNFGNLYQTEDIVVVVDGHIEIAGEESIGVDTVEDKQREPDAAAKQIAILYLQHGTQCTQHIHGTFALAIIDLKNQRTLLAVDRFGVRPLAWGISNGTLVFGSTATSVYANTSIERGLDPQSIFNYVYFHVIPSPRTIFLAIKKLQPAHQLVFESGQSICTRYWVPSYTRRKRADLKGQLLPTLRNAVERASRNTNTGAFLSGGLDSSTVAGLLQQLSHKKSKVFTIGFQQEGYDELEYSRLATRHFGLDLTDYYITPADVLAAIPEVAKAYDEPFGNSSAVPALVCARMAKQNGVDTLLAGDGGDEIFGGNERYATQKLFGFYDQVPQWLDRAIFRPIFFRDSVKQKNKGFQHKVRRYIEQAAMPMPDRTQNYNLLHLMGAENMFSAAFLSKVNIDEPVNLLREEYWQEGPPDQLERLLLTDYKFTLADNDLRKVNRMCELADIDVRYPMLDDEMVAYSNSIPSNVKIKWMELRSFFKSEASKFLPPEIINKTKHGFGLPFGEWLKLDTNLSAYVDANINSLRNRKIFDPTFLDDLQYKHQNEHAAYYGNLVWVLAMLEEWLQQHNLTI